MAGKQLICISLFFLLIRFWAPSQTIEVSGSINENTTWNVDTVKIIGDVIVEKDVLLYVGTGVNIEAQGYFRLHILGSIHAIGSPNDTITFTVNDTTGFWSDTTAVTGGWNGIYIIGEEGSTDSSIFRYCMVQYGKKYDEYGGDINGGALHVYNHGFIGIHHCEFFNNMVICPDNGIDGPFGGAVYCENVTEVRIDSSSFIKNRSFYFSGAIRIDKNCPDTRIVNNIFINNVGYFWKEIPPPWGGYVIGGGGAAISTSDLVYSPEIGNNYCFNNIGLNGIIYTSNLHARVFNNIICNSWGCGIADGHQLSTSKMFNNTIANNKTIYGGILIWSKAEVYNNICWGNEYYPGIEYDQIYVDNANPTLKYNCVQYGDGGQGAIYDYPEFAEPTKGVGLEYDGATADWTLKNWSPCINGGTPDTNSLTIPAYDIIGNIRIFGNRIDMGAYENQEIWAFSNEIEFFEEQVTIFPNPATTRVTISFNKINDRDSMTIYVYDALGKIIFHSMLSNQEKYLYMDVADWQKGLYLIVVSSSGGFLSETKLLVY